MSFVLNDRELTLRTVTNKDEELLQKIYCSTRTAEMEAMIEWGNLQKENFLKMQFLAQHSYYLQHYPNASFWLIIKNNKTIGRLYLDEQHKDGSIRILDITLLPEWRNKGLGKNIILQIFAHAVSKKQSVTLHVEASNRALELYKCLNFTIIGTNDQHYLMEWKFQ